MASAPCKLRDHILDGGNRFRQMLQVALDLCWVQVLEHRAELVQPAASPARFFLRFTAFCRVFFPDRVVFAQYIPFFKEIL